MEFNHEQELKALSEKKISSEEIFDGVILHVIRDTVELPNGHSSIREVIRHIGAVCVIPVTENDEVIVERQYRYPLDRVILEIPAGKLDSPDEDRLSAIQRELREETGYSADEWMNIGDFHPAPAYSDEYITMYLARGLHKGKQDLDAVLAEAKYRVEHDLVDVSDTEPETFGEGGFKDAEELLSWLMENRPSYEPVLTHGDFCLPNIFIKDGKLSGFIDLGNTGTGDRWMDIALCYRSLKHNADGTWSGKVYPDIRPEVLFEELGIKPDWDRINYYILLDELF